MNVESLAEDYLDRLRRGENPSVAEYADRYPALADEIREFFPAMRLVENFKPDSRDDAGVEQMEPPEATESAVPKHLGDYYLLREIGRGGMGVVYEAVQESLGRPVALKVLTPHIVRDARQAKRFEREARAAARLHHTNIVPVFGVGEVDGVRFYAMQYINGMGLDQVLDEVRRLQNRSKTPTTDAPVGHVTKVATVAVAVEPAGISAPNVTVTFAAQALLSGCFPSHPTQVPSDSTSDGARAGPFPQHGSGVTTVGRLSDTAPFVLPGQADNASGSGSLATYWFSVARIGVQVAEALQYAHDHGILHRDVKPSNLLLDGRGTAWVTDFGLAKAEDHEDLTRTGDVVGTLRYMAPELFQNQSDGRSDVYSLGLTLYELLALRPAFDATNRAQLVHQVIHESPPRLRMIDRHIPRDLETIVHKAAEHDPDHRYQTAQELAADLQRYLGDEPIRARRVSPLARFWRWCRKNKAIAAMGMFMAVLLVLAAVVSTTAAVAFRGQRNDLNQAVAEIGRNSDLVRQERDKALTAERDRTDLLVDALYEKVRGHRLAERMGRRFQSLQTLTEAADYLHSLKLPEEQLNERRLLLRNEAIACLALPDFQDLSNWNLPPSKSGEVRFAVDPKHLHYAHMGDDGTVFLRRLEDQTLVDELPRPGATVVWMRYGPDSRRLAVTYWTKAGDEFCVWDTKKLNPTVQVPLAVPDDALDFNRGGSYVAAASTSGSVHVFRLASGQEIKTFPGAKDPRCLRFSPDSRKLALSTASGKLFVRDFNSGSLSHEWLAPGPLSGIDWSPDGKTVAAACENGNVYVHDLATSQDLVFKGHRHVATTAAFHPKGQFLFSASWDGTTRLWDVNSQAELLKTHGQIYRLSPAGDQMSLRLAVGTKAALRQFDPAIEYRTLYGHHSAATRVLNSAFNPRLTLLVTCGTDGVRLWDTTTWTELPLLETGHTTSVAFHPQTGHLWTASERGLHEWPLRTIGATRSPQYRLGPPRYVPTPGLSPSRLVFSTDGSAMAVNGDVGEQHVLVFRAKASEPVRAAWDRDCSFTALSPEGRWLAIGSRQSPRMAVFDAVTGKEVQPFKNAGAAAVEFSPDGKWLATCDAEAVRFYHVGSWQLSHSYEAPGMGYVTFSPDSSLVAMGTVLASEEPNSVHLIQSTTGILLARLENTPAPIQIERQISFSADCSLLAVPHWASCTFGIWDLRAIRNRLSGMGLDWDAPPIPPPADAPSRSLKVSVISPLLVTQLLDRLKNGYSINKQDAKIIDDALAELTLAIDSDPHDPTWCVLRGRLHWVLGRDREALHDFGEAIARDSNHVPAYYYRAYLHWRKHELAEATADYEEVLCREPDHLQALAEAALCYCYLPPFRPNAERALELVERYRSHKSSELIDSLALALYRLGRLDEAEQEIQRWLQRRHTWHKPHLVLAAIFHERGEARRALEAFRKAEAEGVSRLSEENAKSNHQFEMEVAKLLGLTEASSTQPLPANLVVDGMKVLLTARATEGQLELATTGPPAPCLAFRWCPSHTGARLTCSINVPQAGKYRLAGHFRKFNAHARVQMEVAGQVLGKPFDGYSTKTTPSGKVVFGEAEMAAGDNEMTLEITGSNSQSTGYRVWLEQIELTPFVSDRPATEKP